MDKEDKEIFIEIVLIATIALGIIFTFVMISYL